MFYPHGNLIFGTDFEGEDYKLAKTNGNDNELLKILIEKWDSRKFTPLFVSEGETAQKKNTIIRSPYLSSVYNTVLPNLGETIAIFGWSMQKL